jgi:NADPH:quinone reductase-like Zn-dependent oxidoreductase
MSVAGSALLFGSGDMFEELARSMSWSGRLLPIGFTSGEVPRLPMNLPLLKNFSIIGFSLVPGRTRSPKLPGWPRRR